MLDHYILASVTKAGGLGAHHPETGHYATLVIRGLASREEVAEYKRALFRCAHYLARNHAADVSMSVDAAVKRGSKYDLSFRAVDKTLARAHVLAKYGNDPARWPYNPRRPGKE